jgi:hypothetical protein
MGDSRTDAGSTYNRYRSGWQCGKPLSNSIGYVERRNATPPIGRALRVREMLQKPIFAPIF